MILVGGDALVPTIPIEIYLLGRRDFVTLYKNYGGR